MTRGVDSSIIAESLGKLQKTGEIISENKLARILSYGTQKVKTALEGICYRSYLGRGGLPEPKAEIKDLQKSEKRPIKELVKINTRTGDFFSDEDYKNGEEFSMKAIIVGYEEIESPRKEKKIPEKASSVKIRSWIGLLIETLETCKDCESIHRRYFFSKNEQCA